MVKIIDMSIMAFFLMIVLTIVVSSFWGKNIAALFKKKIYIPTDKPLPSKREIEKIIKENQKDIVNSPEFIAAVNNAIKQIEDVLKVELIKKLHIKRFTGQKFTFEFDCCTKELSKLNDKYSYESDFILKEAKQRIISHFKVEHGYDVHDADYYSNDIKFYF